MLNAWVYNLWLSGRAACRRHPASAHASAATMWRHLSTTTLTTRYNCQQVRTSANVQLKACGRQNRRCLLWSLSSECTSHYTRSCRREIMENLMTHRRDDANMYDWQRRRKANHSINVVCQSEFTVDANYTCQHLLSLIRVDCAGFCFAIHRWSFYFTIW